MMARLQRLRKFVTLQICTNAECDWEIHLNFFDFNYHLVIVLQMLRLFKTRHFSRWMRKTELTDNALQEAVAEMAAGLIDADLGGGVVKKRIGVAGRGKRGGVRTLIATNKSTHWFFIHGYEKNVRADVDHQELEVLFDLADALLSRSSSQLDVLVHEGELVEVYYDQEKCGKEPVDGIHT
jgi:hypothetical protein